MPYRELTLFEASCKLFGGLKSTAVEALKRRAVAKAEKKAA